MVTTEFPLSKTRVARPRARNGKDGWLNGLARMIRYRLQIPLKRSRHTPEQTAGGVMVGTVWACTPFFGLHMAGAFLTWLISNKVFGKDFSLIPALAWTWTTNVFTVIPAYYLFYLTGQLMLGRIKTGDEAGQGFDVFTNQIMTAEDHSFWYTVEHWFTSLVSNVGLPLAVGWIPWGILCGWIAYRLSLSCVLEHRKRKARRKKEKRERRLEMEQQAG